MSIADFYEEPEDLTLELIREVLDDLRGTRPTQAEIADAIIRRTHGSLKGHTYLNQRLIRRGVREEMGPVLRAKSPDGVRIWIHDCNPFRPRWIHRDDSTRSEDQMFCDYLRRIGRSVLEEARLYQEWSKANKGGE